MTKAPPVPRKNQSPKGTGDDKSIPQRQAAGRDHRPENPHEQGQPGNIKQNTTHQGHQQDR